MISNYGGLIGYIIAVIYAFKFWGFLYGYLNMLVPFSLLWDTAMFIGSTI